VNSEDRNLKLQNAVLEWQKKYGIRDGDPLLASLELFHIFLRTSEPSSNGTTVSHPPTFGEFRDSFEHLDQRTKAFTRQAAELIQELRKLPELVKQMRSSRGVILLLLTPGVLVAGIIIGKFVP
jgi:hypothetical protein